MSKLTRRSMLRGLAALPLAKPAVSLAARFGVGAERHGDGIKLEDPCGATLADGDDVTISYDGTDLLVDPEQLFRPGVVSPSTKLHVRG